LTLIVTTSQIQAHLNTQMLMMISKLSGLTPAVGFSIEN